MLEFLPKNVKEALSRVNMQFVYEIRVRTNAPICVNYAGKYRFLSDYGLTDKAEKGIRCTQDEVADCVYRAGNYSIYSVEEQIKAGFITAKNGERIGLAGEYVCEKGKILTIRNFTSLCIRVPHEILGCGREIYDRCMSDKVCNLLLASSPGLGKTTILRDLARIICGKTQKNVLICDERGEISAGKVGETCDIMKFSDKETAFEAGIRAMRPDIIVTDELSEKDLEAVKKAVNAGVVVLASAHCTSMERIKDAFLEIFDRFIFLEEGGIGRIKGIYDRDRRRIC